MTLEWLNVWCKSVPELEAQGQAFWVARGSEAVSFPQDGHRDLAALEESSFWFAHRNRIIESVVERFTPRGTLFDVGGGNGYVSLALSRRGHQCVVVEPGLEGAQLAHARGLPVIQAPLHQLTLPSGTIPAVGMFDVLEHIEHPVPALRALWDALQPGGRLFVAVPSYQWLWSDEDRYGGHFRRYTLRRLEDEIAEAGFTPMFGTYFFSFLVPAILLARTLPSWLGLRSAKDREVVARDHRGPKGGLGRLFGTVGDWEQARVTKGVPIPFGTSCLMVAEKPYASG